MLIEVKTKVKRIIDAKTRTRTETFLLNKEFFSEAEYSVTACLSEEQEQGVVESFEILSLRQSPIKEIHSQYHGEYSFVATLKDTYVMDDGTEKHLRYKVLLWADNLTQANQRVHQMAREGYDMLIEGIKEVQYEYITNTEDGETNTNI